MADSKQDEGFKVVDRRLFTESGELRKDAVERERVEEASAAKKAAADAQAKSRPPAKAPGTAEGAATGAPSSPLAPSNAPQPAAEAPAETIAQSRSFQMLIDFLTRNAAAMLGGMADPQTGQAYIDLEGAREVIDMLDALREKTRGNLAKADEDLVIEVVGSLKLTFMEISRAAADAMAKKAAQKK